MGSICGKTKSKEVAVCRIFHDLSAEAEGAAAHRSARVEDSQERAE
jgi:hypothetical protein